MNDMKKIIELLDDRWKIVGNILNAFDLYFEQIRVSFGTYSHEMMVTWNNYVKDRLEKPRWVSDYSELVSQYDILKYHDIGVSFAEFMTTNQEYLDRMKHHRTETTVIELTHTNREIKNMIDEYYKKVPVIDTQIIELAMKNFDYKQIINDRLEKSLNMNKFMMHYMTKNINDDYREVFAKLRNISLLGVENERRIKLDQFVLFFRCGLVPVTQYTSDKYLFAMIGKEYDSNITFEENCKLLSTKETVGIVIIKSSGNEIEYSSRSIVDKKYITKKRYAFVDTVGLNDKILDKYKTVKIMGKRIDKIYDGEVVTIGDYYNYIIIRQHNNSYRFMHNKSFELDITLDALFIPKSQILDIIKGQSILNDIKQNEMEKLIMSRFKNPSWKALITKYEQYAASDEKQKLPLLKTRILENWKNRLTHAITYKSIDDLIDQITNYITINSVVTDAHERTFDFKLDIAIYTSDIHMLSEYTKLLKSKIQEKRSQMIKIQKEYNDETEKKNKIIKIILEVQSDVIDTCIKNNVFISEDISFLKYLMKTS